MKTWMQHPFNRAILIVLFIVALLWGLWHLGDPPTYHLITRIPFSGSDTHYTFFATRNGFLTQEGDSDFVLRDWHGKARWHVSAATANLALWPYQHNSYLDQRKEAFLQNCAISPSGQYLAVATLQESRLHVQLWQDGRLSGGQFLPIDLHQFRNETHHYLFHPITLTVLDNGQTFLAVNTRGNGRLYAMSGSHLLAQGMMPEDSTLAPDAATFVVRHDRSFDYYTVALQGGTLIAKRRYSAQMRLSLWPIFANGIVMAHQPGQGKFQVLSSGGLYDVNGLRQKINADLSSAADDRNILWHDNQKHQLCIYDTTNGASWVMPFANTEDEMQYLYGWPTDTNHVAMLKRDMPAYLNGPLSGLLAPLLSLTQQENGDAQLLQVYQRPKTLLAQLPLHQDANSGLYWNDEAVQWYCCSPDGRTLLLQAKNDAGKYTYLFFRH